MDYQITPNTDAADDRSTALRAAICAYAPSEERYDRITRIAKRLLQVPIALITMIEGKDQWFRSAQGMANVPASARTLAFCGEAIDQGELFQVRDTHVVTHFANHPLVVGAPFVRAYCGWPLELTRGLYVGTICVMDTMPRSFVQEDLEILFDLKHMVESELRMTAVADAQQTLLLESSRSQREEMLDPVTGAWTELGFLALIRRVMPDVAVGKVHAALCAIQLANIECFTVPEAEGSAANEARAVLVCQFIRQRLPDNAVLCRLPGRRACIMFAAKDREVLREQVGLFLQTADSPPSTFMSSQRVLSILAAVLRLTPERARDDSSKLFNTVMGRLEDDRLAVSAQLR